MLNVIWFLQPALDIVAQVQSGSVAENLVSAVVTKSSDQQFEALRDNSSDVAVTSMDNVFMWNRREGGGKFRIVAQIEKIRLSIIARAEFASLADLAGTDILVDAPGNGFVIALQAMLADAGVRPEAYRLKPAGGVRERFDALMAGQGSATLLGAPFEQQALDAGFVRLGVVNDLYPAFPGQGVVARTDRMNEIAGPLEAWLKRLEAARSWISAQPGDVRGALLDAGKPAGQVDGWLASSPDSLQPSREGIELLIAHRQLLAFPGGEDGFDDLVDPRFFKSLP